MGIKEIASACGVSPSTVSRILRGVDLKYASEEVRQRVFEEARRTGYVPNQAARSLKKPVSPPPRQCIAIVQGRGDVLESNTFFLTIARAAMTESLQAGCTLGPQLSAVHSLEQVLAMQGVDGVVVIGRCPDAVMKQIHRRFPYFIYVGCNPANEQYDQVICSGYDAAVTSMTKLIYSGYKRIGYVGQLKLSQRYLGYLDTMRKFGLPIDRKIIFQEPPNCAAVLNACFSAEKPIDALFSSTVNHAVSVLHYAHRHYPARTLPPIIAMEDDPAPQNCSPMLTTMQMPAEEMGRMAVVILLDRMAGGHHEGITLNFHCRYAERESFRQRLPL